MVWLMALIQIRAEKFCDFAGNGATGAVAFSAFAGDGAQQTASVKIMTIAAANFPALERQRISVLLSSPHRIEATRHKSSAVT
jgi:hypothetical protein